MEGKLKIFLWMLLFLILLVLHAIVVGIVCSFVNYFFIDIFTLKNCAGIAIVLTIFCFIKDYEKNKIMIDNKIKKVIKSGEHHD